MALCKDCLHNEVCKYGENRSNGMYCTGEKCKQFKSAADVVEVVRCKDCKHYKGEQFNCWVMRSKMQPEDYCSYGERREK